MSTVEKIEGGVATSAADILAIADMNIRRVWVPAWNNHIFLRTPTALEKGRFEASVAGEEKKRDIKTLKLRLAVMCICDGNGKRLFNDEDIPKLGEKSAQAIETIANESLKMIQITEAELEGAVKN